MRRTSKLFKYVRKPVTEGVATEVKKEEKDFSRWMFKEVILNPNFPRVILLLIGAGSAITYYGRNGVEMNKKGGKRNGEPIGDIKVERYSDRLSKYASSLELATNYTGNEINNRDNIVAINNTHLLQDQLGMNFNDLTTEQLLLIQQCEIKRNLAVRKLFIEKELMNNQSRAKVTNSLIKREAADKFGEKKTIPVGKNYSNDNSECDN